MPFDSEHLHIHYARRSSDHWDTSIYTGACEVRSGHVPADVTIPCTFAAAGEYYLRGEAFGGATAAEGVFVSSEVKVVVQRGAAGDTSQEPLRRVTVTAPAQLHAGEPATFRLSVTGPSADSPHLHIHYATASNPDWSPTWYSGRCTPSQGAVPAETDIQCTFETAGTYYLRGEAKVDGGTFASDELRVDVAAQ
ncbi:MAG: hypothetical protein LC624_03255 [Halobacteriales archaeon]|nr:hypothetical protein [Halobacteriales archaeon]